MTDDGGAAELDALLDESFTRHRGDAVALARRILGDASLAEDAVQLAFVQILVRVRSGDASLLVANPRAVVLRGTRWAALKLAERDRDRHRGVDLDGASAHPATDPWEHAEARMMSRDIVADLPPHYRDALVLRYLEDQPDDSAAARLALTVKAYRRRIDRALVAARTSAARLGSEIAGALAAATPRGVRRWFGNRCLWVDCRIRQVRDRLGPLPSPPDLSQLAIVVAVAGISAAVLAPVDGAGVAVGAAPGGKPDAVALRRADAAIATPAPAANGAAVLSASSTSPSRPGPPPPATPRPTTLVPLLDAPPPSQAQVTQVTPADGFDGSHVVVLSATASSCQCTALYRSDDGGATWRGHLEPQVIGGFALAPQYPADPRVVLWGGSEAACLLATFDATACTPLPLVGRVVFDARFDSGNPVLYGAASPNHGFLAYDVASHMARPLLIPGDPTSVSLQAPPADTVSGMYVVAQASPSSGLSVDGYGPPELFTCDVQLRCVQRSTQWNWDRNYVVDRMDTTGLIVGGYDSGFDSGFNVSTDGGASVAFTVPKKGSGPFLDASYALIGSPGQLAILQDTGGTLTRWGLDGHSETLSAVPADDIVAVTPQRYIVFASQGGAGFWCSVDAGRTWQPSCPVEH